MVGCFDGVLKGGIFSIDSPFWSVVVVPRRDLLSDLHSTMPLLDELARELVRRSSVTLREREINMSALLLAGFIKCEEDGDEQPSALGEFGLVGTSFSEDEEVDDRSRPLSEPP